MTVRIHGRRHRSTQINVTATGNPAPKITISEHTLQNPGFRNHKNQSGLIGSYFAQSRENRVLGENYKLGEIFPDPNALHHLNLKDKYKVNGEIRC